MGDLQTKHTTLFAAARNFKSDFAHPLLSFLAWVLACARIFWLPRTILQPYGQPVRRSVPRARRARGSGEHARSGVCRAVS